MEDLSLKFSCEILDVLNRMLFCLNDTFLSLMDLLIGICRTTEVKNPIMSANTILLQRIRRHQPKILDL